MTAKTSAARRAAFFAALAATGNQTLAAERAKVSRSWVQLHRSTDPAFAADVAAAIALAKARLRGAGGVAPDKAWRTKGGEELAVRGSNGRRTQIARARVKQWTPRAEARFLAALERCANIHMACAAVGLSVPSVYGHRHRWPDFARRWDRAVETGQVVLEAALIDAAGRCLDPNDPGHDDAPDLPLTGMDAATAIQLWRLRGKAYNRFKGRVGGPPKQVSMDEVTRSVMTIVERFERVRQYRSRESGKQRG